MVNKIASILNALGKVIIILSFIIGFLLGIDGYEGGWIIFLHWGGSGLISGIVLIGLAEIIELLHKIAIKMEIPHRVPKINAASKNNTIDQPIR